MPDWKQLLAQHGPNLVLGLMASATGGPQAHGAYLQGTQARQRDDQATAQQQERQALAAQMQQAQLANMDADNQRATQAMELDRLDRLVRRIHELGEQTAATAEDPTTAQQQYLQQVRDAAQLYQVDPSKVSSLATNIGPAVSGKKKKQAAEYIEKLHRMPMFAGYFESPEGLEQLKGLSVPWGEGQKTIGEILMMSGLPLETKAKAPGGGGDGASDLDRSFQREKSAREEALGRPLTTKETAALDREIRASVRAINAPTREQRLTPGQALSQTRSLRNDFVRETAAARSVIQQLDLMKSSMDAVRKGAAAPGSQGVLVTFQKILDPTSVVRESEYARSAAGQSLLSRLEGQWMKIREGGAGVPAEELQKFVDLAEQFARNQVRFANETKRQMDAIAIEYGLNPEHITRDLEADLPTAPPPATTGGVPTYQEYLQRRQGGAR